MDDYSDKEEVKKDKKAEKAAPAPVAPPAEGPHFYRNPDGGRLTTTKPPDTDAE